MHATSMPCELRCALGHLDEQREANQYRKGHIPRLAVVHVAESEQEDRFEEQREELGPDAAAEPEELVHEVAGDPAQGSSEEVHEAESSSQRRCITGCHLEVGPEMDRQLIVPGSTLRTSNPEGNSRCTRVLNAARLHGKLGSLDSETQRRQQQVIFRN